MAIALLASALADDYTVTSPTFDLGPGETVLAVPVPKFNAADHPDTPVLQQVAITLEVTFGGNLTFYGSPTAAEVPYSLASARVTATPTGLNQITPPAALLGLSGTQHVAAGESVSISPQTSGTGAVAAADGNTLTAYQGADTVAYDVDFSALYPQLVSTPPTVVGLVCNDRITGQLVAEYSAEPPLALQVESFTAVWSGVGQMMLYWRAGDEAGVSGFFLERQALAGEWVRVNSQLIPATGNGGGATYQYQDNNAPATGPLNYRLILGTAQGVESTAMEVAAQVGVRLAIQLNFSTVGLALLGPANSQVVIESADDLAPGSWQVVDTVLLDDAGQATTTLSFDPGAATRFYRAR
jgi:hypothetical protein